MADQTFDPRLERLLRDVLAAEAANLPLSVRPEQILERKEDRENARITMRIRRSVIGQRNAGLGRLSAALAAVVIVVVVGAVVLSSLRQSTISPAAPLPTTPDAWSRVVIESAPRTPSSGPGTWPGSSGITRMVAGPRALVATTVSDFRRVAPLYVSADGYNWSVADHSPDRLVVVGTDRGFLMLDDGVWTSEDGHDWERIVNSSDDPDLAGATVIDVAAGGPGFVAVGSDNKAWYSTDGSDWVLADVPRPPAELVRPDYPNLNVELHRIAVAGDVLVANGWAVADNGVDSIEQVVLLASSDGRTWSRVLPQVTGAVWVAGGPNGFVAIRASDGPTTQRVWISADGQEWQAVAGDPFNAYVSGVAAAESGYVAVGVDQCADGDCPPTHVIWTSADGRSWSRVPTGDLFTSGDLEDDLSAVTGSVVAWGSRFVIGGEYDGRPAFWISGSDGSAVEAAQ